MVYKPEQPESQTQKIKRLKLQFLASAMELAAIAKYHQNVKVTMERGRYKIEALIDDVDFLPTVFPKQSTDESPANGILPAADPNNPPIVNFCDGIEVKKNNDISPITNE